MKKKPVRRQRRIEVPKNCAFCEEKKEPTYTDTEMLTRFITERGKIVGRLRNGICSKHQKKLTIAIKYARHLALLPFLVRY